MDVLWRSKEPLSVRDLLEAVNEGRQPPLAYTTVMTIMSRLVDKGVLTRQRQGRGFLYEPTVEDSAALAVRDVVRDFGDAAMAHFVEEAKADPKVLRRLRRLLEDES